ncbi:MAG: protein kinase, partial [Pyrinomonadaceae bacterium]
MTPERWQQVKHLVGLVLEREGDQQRTTLLDEACAGDESLRRAVESYLVAFEEDEAFIEAPAFDVTQALSAAGPADACAGRVVGHYRIIREISHGGMGTVYLAARADEQFEQRVAIKLVNRGMMNDFVLGRFRHERQLLASLEHPNIARLLDGGTTED